MAHVIRFALLHTPFRYSLKPKEEHKHMTHFYDKATGMGNHAISSAAIIDSKGNYAGKVIIRYTPATRCALYAIGWAHEIGVSLGDAGLDLGATLKGDTYDVPAALYEILNSANVKCYDWNDRRVGSWGGKYNRHDHAVDVDSMSDFNDIRTIKIGNKKYTLIWVT